MSEQPNEAEDDKEDPGKRQYCTLSVKTLERLRKLKGRAVYGRSIPGIMAGMIEAGIRAAHKDGYLTDEDMA